MIAKHARLVTGSVSAKLHPAVVPDRFQKKIETGRNVSVIYPCQIYQEICNVSFCDDLVACQPTKTIVPRQCLLGSCLGPSSELFNSLLGNALELVARYWPGFRHNSVNNRDSTEVIPERPDETNDRLTRFPQVHFDGLHACDSSVKQSFAWLVKRPGVARVPQESR